MASMYVAPGCYRIRVAGQIDAHWAERMTGMTARVSKQGDEPAIELTGWLADQAALYGLLNALYDHHCSLLYVEYLGARGEQQTKPT